MKVEKAKKITKKNFTKVGELREKRKKKPIRSNDG